MLRHLLVIATLAGGGCDNLFGLQHIAPGTPPIDSQRIDSPPLDVVPPPDDAAVDSGHSDGLSCPASYQVFASGTYRFVNVGTTWPLAEADCADDSPVMSTMHTHLAVASSDQELSALYFTVAGSAGDLWIGLSDRATQNAFRWVTAEPTGYPPQNGSPWGRAQPSMGVGEDCVLEHAGTTELDDTRCNAVALYVCECDIYPEAPGSF